MINCSEYKKLPTKFEDRIRVVKFMYNVDYPISIIERTFWVYPEEHATFSIKYNEDNFVSHIKTFADTTCSNFTFLKYAFIIERSGELNDTIYADYNLQTWSFQQNGSSECRYDENSRYFAYLSEHYTFFRDCW